MQPQPQQQVLNIRDILTILFKHRYKILIVLILGLAVTGVVWYLMPKQFVARAVVMVKPGREFVQVSEIGDARDVKSQMNQESIINTEIRILTSQDLMLRVIKAVGPEELYPKLAALPPEGRADAAVAAFRQNVGVSPVKGSNLLEVYFRHDKPQIASQVVNTLIEYLKDKHLQVFSDPKSSFLEAQLKEYQEKLKQSESAIGSFKQRNDVFSLDEQRSMLIKDRSEIESALKGEQIRLKELQQRISFLKDRKDIFSDSIVMELRSKLNALEQKEQELTEKYNDGSQVLINHRKEMQIVREQLRKYETQARDTETTRLQAEFEPLQTKIAGLQKRYTEVDSELRKIDGRGREFTDLRREATANEANYQTYLKKTEEARISEDLDRKKMTNITVIEQASLMPAKSNTQKTLGIGIFLSFALALGLAYISEVLPHRMTTALSAEKRLGLPVLVAVPLKKGPNIISSKALMSHA
jgi:polysaccharide biosynthesis protein PslE